MDRPLEEQRQDICLQMLHYEKNNMGNSPEWHYAKAELDTMDCRIENQSLQREILEVRELLDQSNITLALLANATRKYWDKINSPSSIDINK